MHSIALRLPRTLRALFLAVLLVGLGACQAVNHLRDAQDAFSRAAELENEVRFDATGAADPAGALAKLTAVRTGYAACLSSLERIDDDQRAQLVGDQLWGAALTLQALAEWRLGKHDDALKTARAAHALTQPGENGEEPAEQLFPRDAALLAALPGLIGIDLVYADIQEAKAAGQRERLDELTGEVAAALATLEDARGEVDERHPVQAFLLQSKLAGYRNLIVAHQELTRRDPPDAHELRAQAKSDLAALADVLPPGEASRALVAYWAFRCNIDEPR